MKHNRNAVDKRRRRLLLGALACAAPPALAQSLARTPEQTEGPFYSDQLPLDQNNDLTMVAGHQALATDKITDLTGRILDVRGKPMRGVVIETWQVDNNGHYIQSADATLAMVPICKVLAAPRPARMASTTSAPSSPLRTPAARRISM